MNLQTERLNGERPSHAAHLKFAVALFGDPQVGTELWPGALGGPRSPERAEEILRADISHWREHEFGTWYWRERASAQLAARAGLRWAEVDSERAVALDWMVSPRWWRRGFATETASAALAFGFERLELDQIVSFTQTTNVASRGVMEKVGLRFDREIEHQGLPHVLYRVARSDQA